MNMRQVLAAVCAVAVLGNSANAAPPANVNEAIAQMNSDAALISGWWGHEFARAVPFNSTAGNAVPSQLKLFGISVGASVVGSVTEVDNDALRGLGTQLVDTSRVETFDSLPFPMILGNVKVGLPWGLDAGVRLGGIPTTDSDEGDMHTEVSNSVFGLDLRKILIQEGMAKPFGLTLGLNYTHAKGHVVATTDYDFTNTGSGVTLNNAIGTARTDWNTDSIGAQLMINKKIAIFNPYLGVAANKNFGDIDTSITNTGTITHTGTAQTASLDGTGGSARETINDWDLRALLGFELTILPFMRLGIGGEIANENRYSGNVGLRFQFR